MIDVDHLEDVLMDKMLLRIEEAAEVLSLGRSKTYQLIQAGELSTVKVGRAVRVPATAVREFVARQLGEPQARGER